MEYNIVKGDLISLARSGEFDVVVHGCNCFCTMGAGIAPQMAKAFGCDKFPKENKNNHYGDIRKLGNIDYKTITIEVRDKGYPTLRSMKYQHLTVVNAYTQYNYGPNHKDGDQKPLNYLALGLVFQKLNHIFAGQHIGMPKIGCGLAGGNWEVVEAMIKLHMQDCKVTVVEYEKVK